MHRRGRSSSRRGVQIDEDTVDFTVREKVQWLAEEDDC